MLSLNLKKNDIILMPAINFIASYNMASIWRLKIFLVDVDEFTGQVTPKKSLECIKNNRLKIDALIVMFNEAILKILKNFMILKKSINFL